MTPGGEGERIQKEEDRSGGSDALVWRELPHLSSFISKSLACEVRLPLARVGISHHCGKGRGRTTKQNGKQLSYVPFSDPSGAPLSASQFGGISFRLRVLWQICNGGFFFFLILAHLQASVKSFTKIEFKLQQLVI